MNKKIILFFGLIFYTVSFSQNPIMDSKEKKYCKNYFLAEKYKLTEDNEKALSKYQECIKINFNESGAFFEIAKILFSVSDFSEAAYYCEQAVLLDGKNKWYMYLLIQIYRYQFEYEKEAQMWEKLIETYPLNPEYYFDGARVYLELPDYKKAIKLLKKYEKEIGPNDQIVLLKSQIFQEQDDEKKYLKCLEVGLKIFPNSLILLEELAQFYIKKSEYNSANRIYEKIVKIDPTNSTALLTSYTIYQNKNNIKEEKNTLLKIINSYNITEIKKQELLFEIFTGDRLLIYYEGMPVLLKKCISLYPENTFFYTLLADFYSVDEQYELARTYYLKSIDHENGNKLLWERLIYMDLFINNHNQTITDANLAIEMFPLQANFYYYKGLAKFYNKNYDESIKTLNEALVYTIDDIDLFIGIYETLGNAYHSLAEKTSNYKYHKNSDENYEKALEYGPNNELILNNYSYYLSLRGENLEHAKKMIEKCIKLSEKDQNPSFLDTYAWVLFKLKEYNEAEKIMKKCIEHGGGSSVIYDHYGDILYALDLKKRALIEWKRALEQDNSNKKLEQKILNFQKND